MLICFSGTGAPTDSEVIISEEEYLEIQRLRDLKGAYRQDFTEFRSLKSEVQYCQKLVDQCRQRLVQGRYYINGLAQDCSNSS